jgi:hypothetical protein
VAFQSDIDEIDLLAEVTGLGAFDDVRQHSITVGAFERQIATLDLPGLIRAKRATGRDKDLTTLAELESAACGKNPSAPLTHVRGSVDSSRYRTATVATG